jgi:transposase-like protein
MKYTFRQFQKQYPNDDACLDAIFATRYGNPTHCPECGVESKLTRIQGRRAYACQEGCHIYPCVGSIFEKSSTPLTLWFHAMYLMTSTRNGVSAKELQRQLGVTYKCAHRIGHKLRELMSSDAKANSGPLSGNVEVDETYVGGKLKNKHKSKRVRADGLSGRGTIGKTIVVGAVEREGDLVAKVVENTDVATLTDFVHANVSENVSLISTDEHSGYKYLKNTYPHGTVTHSSGEYVNGLVHTNTIEGFWSHFKRGIRSTHASISRQHTNKYVGEFVFRFNNRHDSAGMFNKLISSL